MPAGVVCSLTVEGLEVDRESVSLAVTFTALSTHVRPVSGVRPHVSRQFNRLGELGFAILTHIHLPYKNKDKKIKVQRLRPFLLQMRT